MAGVYQNQLNGRWVGQNIRSLLSHNWQSSETVLLQAGQTNKGDNLMMSHLELTSKLSLLKMNIYRQMFWMPQSKYLHTNMKRGPKMSDEKEIKINKCKKIYLKMPQTIQKSRHCKNPLLKIANLFVSSWKLSFPPLQCELLSQ